MSEHNITEGDRRLLVDCAVCGFALIGPAPEQLTDLVRRGLWHIWFGPDGAPLIERLTSTQENEYRDAVKLLGER